MKVKMGRPKNEIDFTTCISGYRLQKVMKLAGRRCTRKVLADLIHCSETNITHYTNGRSANPYLRPISEFLFKEYNATLRECFHSAEDLYKYLCAEEWKEYSEIILKRFGFTESDYSSRVSKSQLDRDFFSLIVWDVEGLDDPKLREERKVWYDYFEKKVILPNRERWAAEQAANRSGRNQEWIKALESLTAARPTFFDFDLSNITDEMQYYKFVFRSNGLLARLYSGSITPAEFTYYFKRMLKDLGIAEGKR